MKIKTMDPIVQQVIKQLDERSLVGLKKYKISLEDDERKLSEWIQMALEEVLDQANYLQKIKNELEKKGL